ncbi:hypothetical protein HanIR_Chr03g0116881 [Helianthus annuus]|nr:hypothetical protein HanIR_Chr03g0116881 [Helianthus annuus]
MNMTTWCVHSFTLVNIRLCLIICVCLFLVMYVCLFILFVHVRSFDFYVRLRIQFNKFMNYY